VKIGLPNIPPVVVAVAAVLLAGVLVPNSRRACERATDLEVAAGRSGLVKVHESRGHICRVVVYARGNAPWGGYERVAATPGVVVIRWPEPDIHVYDNPRITRVGGAEVYGDPDEVARLLSLAARR
jgi:hypothetical protein